MSNETTKHAASLWTSKVSAQTRPLKEAAIDASVSAETLREAALDARGRAAAFVRPITEALLLKTV